MDTVPVLFVPGTAELTAASRAALLALRPGLPSDARLTLAAGDDLADERARSVGITLNREVDVSTPPLPQLRSISRAELYVASQRLLPTECLAPGQPVPRDNWPGDDDVRARTLPPGCAVANALQQMVVDKRDLLRGRPLPPGAALPVARAIERYYNRGDGPAGAATGSAAAPALGPGSSTSAALSPDGAGATSDGAGLLQGPLTPAGPAKAGPTTAGPATAGQ